MRRAQDLVVLQRVAKQHARRLVSGAAGSAAKSQPDPAAGWVASCRLHARDMDASVAFYRKVIPFWRTSQGNRGEQLISVNGSPVGAITSVPPAFESVAPSWLPEFIVDDCKAVLEKLNELGGSEVPGYLNVHFAKCVDPHGAHFSIQQRAWTRHLGGDMTACRPTAQPAPGCLNWLDYLGDDGGGECAMADFYAALLGWETDVRLPFPGGKYVIGFEGRGRGRSNGSKICGLLPRKALLPSQPRACWLPFFSFPSADAVKSSFDVVVPSGGGAVVPPTAILDGTFAIVRDVDGAPFALFHRTDVWDEVRKYA